jgi:hypothetical protein
MSLTIKVKQQINANNKKRKDKTFNNKFIGLLGAISIIFIASAAWVLIDPTPTAETNNLKTSEINFIVKQESLIATSKNAFENYNTDTLGQIIHCGGKLFQGLRVSL